MADSAPHRELVVAAANRELNAERTFFVEGHSRRQGNADAAERKIFDAYRQPLVTEFHRARHGGSGRVLSLRLALLGALQLAAFGQVDLEFRLERIDRMLVAHGPVIDGGS